MQIIDIKIKLSSQDINQSAQELLSKYKFKLDDLLLSLNDDGLIIQFKYKVAITKVDFVVKLSNVYVSNDDVSLDMRIIKPRIASMINIGPISNLLNNKLTHLGIRYNNGKVDIDLEQLYPHTPIKNIDIKKVKIVNGYLEIEVSNFELEIKHKDKKAKKRKVKDES